MSDDNNECRAEPGVDRNNGDSAENRDPRGRFKQGNGGRRPGSRNKATIVAERLLAGESEALVRKSIAMALDGNATVLTALLRCLVGPMKERPAPIKCRLPAIESADDAARAIARTVNAVADGQLDPDSGQRLVDMIAAGVKVREMAEFEQRLSALETAQKEDSQK